MSDIDISRSDWHVLTKTENGQVSLIRNLPLREAVAVYARLDPSAGRVSNQMYLVNDGDIRERHILGPEGWDGCTKAAAHSYPDMPERTTEAGPNAGRRYRSGSCVNCGAYSFEWIDA